MNPLRLLDPRRSLTPTMWAIIALAFAAWLLGLLFALGQFQRLSHPNYFQGFFCLYFPMLVFSAGSLTVNKQLGSPPSPKPVALITFLTSAILFAFIAATYLPKDPNFMLAVDALVGVGYVVTVSWQWSKRASASKIKSPPGTHGDLAVAD